MGAVVMVPAHLKLSGYYSRHFLVPEKDGNLCPILNLRLVYRYMETAQFKLLRSPTLLPIVEQTCWLSSVERRNVFFRHPVMDGHGKYLRFLLPRSSETIQHMCGEGLTQNVTIANAVVHGGTA